MRPAPCTRTRLACEISSSRCAVVTAAFAVSSTPVAKKFVPVSILGVTDPDGDPLTIVVTSVTQDEPVNARGDGSTCPDAQINSGQALVRAERSGTPGSPGNGRVYAITFTADDGKGGQCASTVNVCMPHDQSHPTCVDDGQFHNSLGNCRRGNTLAPEAVSLDIGRVSESRAEITFVLPEDSHVDVSVFDVAGRRLATIERTDLAAGVHQRAWNMEDVSKGLYFIRMHAGEVTLTKTIVKLR